MKNIIFLLSDQQRQDTVSCYGQPLGTKFSLTPNLDRLAAEGTRFNCHISNQPVCGPARACIQTGIYPSELDCSVNDKGLIPGTKTLAHFMREAGYETAYVGKWHLASRYTGNPEHPEHADYRTRAIPEAYRGGYKDYWVASDVLEFTSHGEAGVMFDQDMNERHFDIYRVDATCNFALDFIRQPHERPFFLFVSFIEPHHQNDRGRVEGPEGWAEQYQDFPVPLDLQGTEGDWKKEMPDYLAACKSLDDNVGRIVNELKATGLYDETLIFYTSDHSCHFRTRNSEYKRACHDNATLVPFIAKGDVFDGGHVVDELSALIDIAPTLLCAAGVEKPFYMPGEAMQKLVSEAQAIHEAVYIQISESGFGRAIRDHKFLYGVEVNFAPEALAEDLNRLFSGDLEHAFNAQAHMTHFEERYFYDLEKDPYQRKNLVDDPAYQEQRAQYRRLLLRELYAVEGQRGHIDAYGQAPQIFLR